MELHGISAIVTGGASGLGRATALRLVEQGAHVYVFDLQRAIDDAAAQEGITYLPVDVTDPESVKAGVDQAVNGGTGPLRVAINCAGIGTPGRILGKGGVHDFAKYTAVITVNLIGTFQVLALAAEAIAATEPVDEDGQRGVIINTASVAAFEGQVGQAAYASSKGGVVGLTLPAARDLASHGIRVNTIAPGIVDTPMMAGIDPEFRTTLEQSVPFPHRLATPDEYAELALDIIRHDYLNGQVTRMDGAIRMSPR
ncbi:SDR family NAD(P)-dependent oxidoreductase [Kocuria massiliensis]|uniref:SDR family NAD(P)-dependent oxidoreductase n=1 Tax=Kocuria massiliensis TaxID=1926282 RepID=UPI000A1C9BAA|nr:SDR family NAD(P)-dependent oxidoreductase [Kocuria massiliensis]